MSCQRYVSARLAVEAGAAGVIVSNHGARQLDYVPATISCLEEVPWPTFSVPRRHSRCVVAFVADRVVDAHRQVVNAAQGQVPVFLDGGVRRGTDVFKALALGASGVFVRRSSPHLLSPWSTFWPVELTFSCWGCR